MPVTAKIVGLTELEKKLDGKFLLQPEIEPALDSVANRWLRKGKGVTEQANSLSVQATPLHRVMGTTLNARRTTGRSRRDKNMRSYLPPVIRNSLAKAARNIAARFGS